MITYDIVLDNPVGEEIGSISDWISFEVSRSVNTLGAGVLTVRDTYPIGYWRKNMRVRIYRAIPGYSPQLIGRTVWFVRGWELDEEAGTWTIFLQDNFFILKRMLVAYPGETTYADKTIEEGTNDEADDLIKAFVRENGGSLTTDPDREVAGLSVEVNTSLGVNTEKTAPYANLLDTLNGLASDSAQQGTTIFFDLIWRQSVNDFFFYTREGFLGADRTVQGLTFSKGHGNLTAVRITWDYREEVTVVYVGGEGQGAGRLVATVENATALLNDPFARIESFTDARDAVEDTVLEAEGRLALYKATPKATLTGEIIDSPLSRFGVHFDYGDQVYAEARGITFTAHIDAFSINVSTSEEVVNVKLKGVAS